MLCLFDTLHRGRENTRLALAKYRIAQHPRFMETMSSRGFDYPSLDLSMSQSPLIRFAESNLSKNQPQCALSAAPRRALLGIYSYTRGVSPQPPNRQGYLCPSRRVTRQYSTLPRIFQFSLITSFLSVPAELPRQEQVVVQRAAELEQVVVQR